MIWPATYDLTQCGTSAKPDGIGGSLLVKSAMTNSPQHRKAQQLNSLATIMAYHRFCCQNSRYHHTMSNQLHMMRWVDDRRIEMLAEGRPHWVPSMDEYEQAMRDCWDDLGKR